MLSGHRSAWRRRARNSRAARIAIPLAIPMALGLTLGVVLAVSGGPGHDDQSVGARVLAPRRPASAAPVRGTSPIGGAAAASASASPPLPLSRPTRDRSASPAVAARSFPRRLTFANGPTAFFPLGDLATNPVDGTGAAISLNQTAAEAAASMNCTLTVPNNP